MHTGMRHLERKLPRSVRHRLHKWTGHRPGPPSRTGRGPHGVSKAALLSEAVRLLRNRGKSAPRRRRHPW